jgi:hypothetical protein
MKQIEPINIWAGGVQHEASFIKAHIIFDNLVDNATFYYELLKQNEVDEQMVYTSLSAGNVAIAGAAYEAWGENEDINQSAYEYLATTLNLELI